MTTVTKSFTAVDQVSDTLSILPGRSAAYTITGTFVATLVLEHTLNNGETWTVDTTLTATATSTVLSAQSPQLNTVYRFRCSTYTSGTAVLTMADAVGTILTFTGPGQSAAALTVNDNGIVVPLVTATLAQFTGASVAGTCVASYGSTSATGLLWYEVEEVVSLAAAGAKFVAMTCVIPAGAIILSSQMNIDTLVVAGGTSVKVGLGLHGGTCNTWGNTAVLTKNAKANLLGTTVLAGDTTPEVCACASTATGLGDTNFSAGAVRVRIVYLKAANLPDA